MRLICFITLCFIFSTTVRAQEPEDFSMKGKSVGVYFTRKHFSYDDSYLIPLSQFIKSDQGVSTTVEDIEMQALVSIGRLFVEQADSFLDADSIFFLNENPVYAKIFMNHYNSNDHFLRRTDSLRGADLIAVVNPFVLGSTKSTTVYTQSNKIITEPVNVKNGRIRVEFFEPATGYLVGVFEACLDEGNLPRTKVFFNFRNNESPTGRFIAGLFSVLVTNINEKRKSNCVIPGSGK